MLLGNLRSDELPKLALNALIEGYDTPSLRISAGLNDDFWEIDLYLKLTLKEMNIGLPNKTEAGFIIIKYYLQRILDNNINPVQGIEKIIFDVLRKNDYLYKEKKYAYDYLGFEKLYGLYYEYDDMNNSCILVSNEYRQERIKEINVEIKSEVLLFLDKYERIRNKVINDKKTDEDNG